MSNEPVVGAESERLESFRAFLNAAEEGAAIPPVSADDIRTLHQVSIDMSKRYSGKDGVVSLEVMARALSPDANLAAVWFRYTRLRKLAREGLLEQWRHQSYFDDFVYQVTATIPMNGTYLGQDEFIQRLRSEAEARS